MPMEYSQFRELLRSMESLQRQHEAFLREFLLEMGLRLMAQTKKLTPVDNGDLRRSWELKDVMQAGNSLYIELVNPQEYASFVEDGHRQTKRFLPIEYLEQSKNSKPYLNYLYEKYGDDIPGVMLHEKWIPGHYMARISIQKIEREIPKRYKRAFAEFLKGLEVQ